MRYKQAVNIISIFGLILTVLFMAWCWKQGILTSQENMQKFIMGFGAAAGIIFVIIQIVQVIVPIIPGGISCVVGVVRKRPKSKISSSALSQARRVLSCT